MLARWSLFKRQALIKCVPLLALSLLVGCEVTNYETAPVSGTVTLKGKPAENVWVQFEPANKTSQDLPSSTATTDAQGRYELKLAIPDGEPGAVIGEHIVRFAPAGGDEEVVAATEGPEADAAAGPVMRLSEEATSGKMRYTVPPEGDTAADFALE